MTAHEQMRNLSAEACKIFFQNVDYLRKQKGLSYRELARELRAMGGKSNKAAIPIYSGLRGAGSATGYFRASTFYLSQYALYFGVSIQYLFSVDLAAQEEANKEDKGKP